MQFPFRDFLRICAGVRAKVLQINSCSGVRRIANCAGCLPSASFFLSSSLGCIYSLTCGLHPCTRVVLKRRRPAELRHNRRRRGAGASGTGERRREQDADRNFSGGWQLGHRQPSSPRWHTRACNSGH